MTPIEIALAAEMRARAARVANGLPEAEGFRPNLGLPQRERHPPKPAEKSITPQQAICLSLYYQQQASVQEIAAVLNVSKTRIAQIIHKALRSLSVESVRELAKTVPEVMVPKLMRLAACLAPIKWRHEPEGDRDWRKP